MEESRGEVERIFLFMRALSFHHHPYHPILNTHVFYIATLVFFSSIYFTPTFLHFSLPFLY